MVVAFANIKLGIMDLDFFCRDINVLKSEVIVEQHNKILNAKSLLCLASLNPNEELRLKINPKNEMELNTFKQIIRRYGGKIE